LKSTLYFFAFFALFAIGLPHYGRYMSLIFQLASCLTFGVHYKKRGDKETWGQTGSLPEVLTRQAEMMYLSALPSLPLAVAPNLAAQNA
jgi:hypothetical protein